MSTKIIKTWVANTAKPVQDIEIEDIITAQDELSVEDRLTSLEDKPIITKGNLLVGNGTQDCVEMTPSEVLSHINGASVATMTTEEYDALTDDEVNANTLYVLTDSDNSVSADDVYFEGELITTYPIGNISLDNGSAVLIKEGERKSLRDLWNAIYRAKLDPEVTHPSAIITVSDGTGEVGTTYSRPKAKITVYTGKYSYGSVDSSGNKYSADDGTGITFTMQNVQISCDKGTTYIANNNMTDGSSLTYNAWAADNQETTYTDGSTSYKFTGVAKYTESDRVPVNNIGEKVESLRCGYKTAGNVTEISVASKTATFTGYRPFFYGAITVAPTSANLTSAVIRELTNGGNYNQKKTFVITAEDFIPDGDDRPEKPNEYLKAFVVAIPTKNTRGRIKSVSSTAGMTVDMTDSYSQANFTVRVADASGVFTSTDYEKYDIYVWNPASIDAGTVHEFTLS